CSQTHPHQPTETRHASPALQSLNLLDSNPHPGSFVYQFHTSCLKPRLESQPASDECLPCTRSQSSRQHLADAPAKTSATDWPPESNRFLSSQIHRPRLPHRICSSLPEQCDGCDVVRLRNTTPCRRCVRELSDQQAILLS